MRIGYSHHGIQEDQAWLFFDKSVSIGIKMECIPILKLRLNTFGLVKNDNLPVRVTGPRGKIKSKTISFISQQFLLHSIKIKWK